MRRLVWLAPLVAGCTVQGNFGSLVSPDADPLHPYPAPRGDFVPAVGSDATLEIACWNIENFPATPRTPSLVADVIASLDLDVVVVEEIANEAAWDELLARLPDHDGVLSTHRYTDTEYQKIGVIYRSSLVAVGQPTLLFTDEGYTFPRPPLSIAVTVDDATIELIGIHLKAGREDLDAERRRDAVVALDAHLRAQIDGGAEPEVVVLGDYNERVTDPASREVLAPLLGAPDRYTVRSEPRALAGGYTYLGFGGSFIDHVTTTVALDARWGGARLEVPPLNITIPGYRDEISDHLPVVVIVPRPQPPQATPKND